VHLYVSFSLTDSINIFLSTLNRPEPEVQQSHRMD